MKPLQTSYNAKKWFNHICQWLLLQLLMSVKTKNFRLMYAKSLFTFWRRLGTHLENISQKNKWLKLSKVSLKQDSVLQLSQQKNMQTMKNLHTLSLCICFIISHLKCLILLFTQFSKHWFYNIVNIPKLFIEKQA